MQNRWSFRCRTGLVFLVVAGAFAFCDIASAQEGCSQAAVLTQPVQDSKLLSGLSTKIFAVNLGRVSNQRFGVNIRLSMLLAYELPNDHQPSESFDCASLVFSLVPRRGGFYVISYISPAGRDQQSGHEMLSTFTFGDKEPGSDAVPFLQASRRSECEVPGFFTIACPRGWEVNYQDREDENFFQWGWGPGGNDVQGLYVIWYSYTAPHRIKDGSLEMYSSADDFAHQWLNSVFGISPFTLNPGIAAAENPREQFIKLASIYRRSSGDQNFLHKFHEVAVSLNAQAGLGTTLGLLGVHLDDGNYDYDFVDLETRNSKTNGPYLYEIIARTPLSYLNQGAKYKARVFINEYGYPNLDLSYGDAHLFYSSEFDLSPTLPDCPANAATHWTFSDGNVKCVVGASMASWVDPPLPDQLEAKEHLQFLLDAKGVGPDASYQEENADSQRRHDQILQFLAASKQHLSEREQLSLLVYAWQNIYDATPYAFSSDSLQKDSETASILRDILSLGAELQPAPAIPSDAREHYLKAYALMQISNPTKDNISTAAQEFQQALHLAPWWGDAHFNLASALEASGQYDDAIKQFQFYLLSKPKEMDAQVAQARIFAIQAEKQNAANREEQHERELASKYVSGDAQRVSTSFRDQGTYGYRVPEEEPYWANVFRMHGGALVGVFLDPQVKGGGSSGDYGGDQVGVCNLDEFYCYSCPFGRVNQQITLGSRDYTVSVSSEPGSIVNVTDGQATIAVPVDLLYRARALKSPSYQCGGNQIPCVVSGGQTYKYAYFTPETRKAAKDPSVNALSLVPNRVIVGGTSN